MAVMSACDGVEEEERHHDEEGAEVGGLQQRDYSVAEPPPRPGGGRHLLHLLQLPLQLLLVLSRHLPVPAQTSQGSLNVHEINSLF